MPMPIFEGEELRGAEAIAELCYTNPFSARRIELEKAAVGRAFREGQSVWNRASSRFENPNIGALRERCGALLHKARARLERGAKPSARERVVYEDLALYGLFDRFDDELTALIG